MSQQTYIHVFIGDFWANKINYEIEINMPTKHASPKEAKQDGSSARFEKRNGEVVLVIYSSWEQGFNSEGKWYEHIKGTVLDIIRWEESWKYKMMVENPKQIKGNGIDYIPCATRWNELFKIESLPDQWCNTVESLAYKVIACIDI